MPYIQNIKNSVGSMVTAMKSRSSSPRAYLKAKYLEELYITAIIKLGLIYDQCPQKQYAKKKLAINLKHRERQY